MKSDVIAVSSKKDVTDQVLIQAEKVAVYQELSHRNALHLRLIAEEMMSMMRAIAGDVNGEFWIENNGKDFELHLRALTATDYRTREKLLSASTSGKNDAFRGFMGKIRSFFEPIEGVPMYFELSSDGILADRTWTMHSYQMQVRENMQKNREGAAEAWDELEKSVIGHVADDIKVSIRGFDVEMTVFKKMD